MTTRRGIWTAATAGSMAVVAFISIEARPATSGRASVKGALEPVSQPALSRYGGTVVDVLVRAGQRVRRGDVLVRFDAAKLRAKHRESDIALRAAESAGENGKIARRLPNELRAYLLNSDPEIAAAEAAYAKALAAFDSAPANGRSEAQHELERAAQRRTRVRIQVQRSMAEASGAGQYVPVLLARIRDDRKALDELLADTEVRAPADGVLDILAAHAGDRVPPGGVIAVLTVAGEYACDLRLPDAQAARLRTGMPLWAILEGSRQRIRGRVESLSVRKIPAALREDRSAAEEHMARARISSAIPLPAGTAAEFELP